MPREARKRGRGCELPSERAPGSEVVDSRLLEGSGRDEIDLGSGTPGTETVVRGLVDSIALPTYISSSLVSVVEREARRVVDDVHVVAEVALLFVAIYTMTMDVAVCVTGEPYALVVR